MSVITYIIILAVLILLHEFGHFWAARRNGIVVEEFGLGLPPKLVTLGRWGETEFTLNLLPIGGFARMRGEEEDAGPGSFWSAPAKARAMVLLAGPLMNIITAVVVLTLAYMFIVPHDGLWILGVAPDYPAAEVGIQPGDVILAVDGERVTSRDAFVAVVRAHPNTPVELTIRRGRELLTVQVTPKVDPRDNVPRIGVLLAEPLPMWKAPLAAISELFYFLKEMIHLPAKIIAGHISPGEARPVGPVGIGRIFVGVVSEQPTPIMRLFAILRLTATISFALGITNLLPIPALDGGRLVFVLLEWLRGGKRISPEKESLVHLVGMALLLALMALITYYDIRYPPKV